MFSRFLRTNLLQTSYRANYACSLIRSYCLAGRIVQTNEIGQLDTVRSFHSSIAVFGGKDKKSNKSSNSSSESSASLPDVKTFDKAMIATVDWSVNEMGKLKVGAPTVDVFNSLPVPGHGTIGKLGQVVLKSSTKLVISLFEPSTANAVADALKNSSFKINPTIEGSNLLATIPKPSKEARDVMVKSAGRIAEKVKKSLFKLQSIIK